MTRRDADVVVVGARCAGAAVARLLSVAGLRVVVLERGGPDADTLSTHALMRGAVLQLSRWGVLDAVRASGTPVVRRTTFIYGDDPVVVDIEPRGDVDGLYAPRRTVLDRLLAEAAGAAGADVRYHQRVTGILRDNDGRVCGVEFVDHADRCQTLVAPWVIGADGRHSTVARLVEAPVEREWTHMAAVAYAHWPNLPVDGYRWYFAPGLSAGAIPTTHDHACVFVSMPPSTFRTRCHGRLDAGYRQILADVAPDVATRVPNGPPPEGYRGFGGQPGFVRCSHGPGWALVGDAGTFRDPITAHGITDALRDAEAMAAAIVADTALGWLDYDHQRAAVGGPIAELSDRIASFDWSLDEVQRLHLALSRAMGREAKAIAAPQ